MNIKYEIVLHSPMGPKKGILDVNKEGDKIKGSLQCLGEKHLLSGKITGEGEVFLKGILKSPLGEEPFTLVGTLQDEVFQSSFQRKQGSYQIRGRKIESSNLSN